MWTRSFAAQIQVAFRFATPTSSSWSLTRRQLRPFLLTYPAYCWRVLMSSFNKLTRHSGSKCLGLADFWSIRHPDYLLFASRVRYDIPSADLCRGAPARGQDCQRNWLI